MIRRLLIPVLLLTVSPGAALAQDCAAVQTRVDGFATGDLLVDYLKVGVEEQQDFTDLFLCLAGPQRIPTEILGDANPRDFIYGQGWGSIRANADIPYWNEFWSHLGAAIWGGKILKKSENSIDLLNLMRDRKTMSYAAEVYKGVSLLDGKDVVTLDYRNDDTVPLVSATVVRRVEDELREITYRGQPSGIFLGRANLFKGKLSERFSEAWTDPDKFIFAANFILDFRIQNQSIIPDWALAFYE